MCDCVNQLNEKLKEYNTKISIPISFTKGLGLRAAAPIIATEKADISKRMGPTKLFASYCPFCGEKLGEQ